ncbi:MAG: FG-GAP repeat domain-containing protein [Rhodothermales bacterium]
MFGEDSFTKYCLEIGEGQSAMTLVDINEDGHLDLAVVNEASSELILFIGDGTGSLKRVNVLDAGENPTSVTAADLNEDGNVDLVIANHETSYLTLLNGDGKGSFQEARNSPLYIPVEPHPHVARVADVDQDGHLDLLVDHRSGRGLLVIRGLGAGTFESQGEVISTGGDPYRGFALGDINGDQRPDLVTPNSNEIGIVLSSNPEGMSFDQLPSLQSTSPFAVDIIDSNGDGKLDIVSASNNGRMPIQVFYGDKKNRFQEAPESPFRMNSGAKQIATGDTNGDGYGDVLVSNWTTDLLLILGDQESLRTVSIEGIDTPWGLAIGDLNEDGKDDVLIGDGVLSKASIFLSQDR